MLQIFAQSVRFANQEVTNYMMGKMNFTLKRKMDPTLPTSTTYV